MRSRAWSADDPSNRFLASDRTTDQMDPCLLRATEAWTRDKTRQDQGKARQEKARQGKEGKERQITSHEVPGKMCRCIGVRVRWGRGEGVGVRVGVREGMGVGRG